MRNFTCLLTCNFTTAQPKPRTEIPGLVLTVQDTPVTLNWAGKSYE